MVHKPIVRQFGEMACVVSGVGLMVALLAPVSFAQDRDRDRDADRLRDTRIERLDPGTVIPVRTDETIDSDRGDNRIYPGIVDQDVRGDNGRLVIPRGSRVELIVRTGRDNDLVLDLESVMVDGQRYGVRAEPKHLDTDRDDGVIGNILGAINGSHGRTVRIPRDSVVTFRLARPLDIGVQDRGRDRDGRHYHDYYDQDRNR